MKTFGAIFLLLWTMVLVAPACQICLPYPVRTLADDIIETSHLALAREDPERPFTLAITAMVKGSRPPTPCELFLDSSSRRILAANPQNHILCIFDADKDAPEWRRVAMVDPAREAIIREVLEEQKNWGGEPIVRVTYFAQFLGHEDAVLSDLAHLEVARAPYSVIRELSGAISREELRRFLGDIRMIEWQALYILFLGRSGHPEDEEYIREQVLSHARFSLMSQSSAWATALIEIDGAAGLDVIAEAFLNDPNRDLEEISAIVAAMRVHADGGRTELQDEIVRHYGAILNTHPRLAPELADDLTRWQRFDHAATFSKLLAESDDDLNAMMRIRNHLRGAESATATPKVNPLERFGVILVLVAILVILSCLLAGKFRRSSAQHA